MPRAGGGGGGITVAFNAPVYGLLDFEQRVKQIIRDAARQGGFRGVLVTP